MIIDAATLPDGTVRRTPVLIIGAGPAGMTVARSLLASGVEVTVLESGGKAASPETQALSDGDVVDGQFVLAQKTVGLEDVRMRALGGSTGHWGGLCRPLDPIDVAPRPEINRPGWPIAYEELVPWYRAAQATCELGPYSYDAEPWFGAVGQRPPSVGSTAAVGLYRLSPTRFGSRYRQDLDGDDRCTAILHATAVALVTTADGGHVRKVDAIAAGGARLSFEAEVVVLATGGIDVPRLLLLSSQISPVGVANDSGLVGVGFMEHPHLIARLSMTLDAVAPLFSFSVSGKGGERAVFAQASFALTNDTVRERGLFNAAMTLGRGISDTASGSDRLALGVNELLAAEGREPEARFVILRSEQPPADDHVVRLGGRRDPLGLPVAEVSWNVDHATRDSMRTTLELLAKEIGEAGLGRLQVPEENSAGASAIEVGCHHMGTARMSEDPSQGVVDRDCRCHQVDNLYIAGSAVFPSAGYANPTLTLVALAHRLGDTLSMRLTGAPSPLGR